MTQRLVYFMGPSGAGKDSLLDWLRAQLPEHFPLRWARRTISRPMGTGGEAHESVTPHEFAVLREAETFALHWEANGLCYGIRHEELSHLMAGGWVLLNGSRAYLPQALERCPQMAAVHITASPEVLRHRLLARGREPADQVEARVQRALAFEVPVGVAGIEVHNNGALDDAGRKLLKALAQLPGWPAADGTLAPPAAPATAGGRFDPQPSPSRCCAADPAMSPVVTIYHNPKCGTSRNTLAMIRNSGVEPEVIEYLKAPPDRATLVALIAATGAPVIDAVRTKEALFTELQLGAPAVTDAQLIDAMLAHPILINRPLVTTPLGTRLCRPSELVLDILPAPQQGAFTKEDGEAVVNAQGQRV